MILGENLSTYVPKKCETCMYRTVKRSFHPCNYLAITGKARSQICGYGDACTVYKRGKAIVLDADASDAVKQTQATTSNSLTKYDYALVRELYKQGLNYATIAKKSNIPYSAVVGYCRTRNMPNHRQDSVSQQIESHYHQGKTDAQIAQAAGCAVSTVANWRHQRHLPAQLSVSQVERTQKIAELYQQGLPDAMIAKQINCTPKVIARWRKQHNLASHGRGKITTKKSMQPEQMMQCYLLGFSDEKIAQTLGYSVYSVTQWRRQQKLSKHKSAK